MAKAVGAGFDQAGFLSLTHLNLQAGEWLQPETVSAALDRVNPHIIINTLGWSDDGRLASAAHLTEPTRVLVEACREREVAFIQLSSYRVFSGVKSGFVETDEPLPRDECGELYLACEKLVATLPRHIILRLSWVIGWQGENLLTKIINPLLAGDSAAIVGERRGSPVGHSEVVRVLSAMAKQISCGAENWGLFHYSSGNVCTEEEFAAEVERRVAAKCTVTGGLKDTSGSDTEPVSAALGYRRLMECFGIQPRTWKQALGQELGLWFSHHPMLLDSEVNTQ